MIDTLLVLGWTLISGWFAGRVEPLTVLPTAPTLARDLPANVAGQTLAGTVISYGEGDENEWLIQTATGVVVADAGPRWFQVIDIPQGEAITLTGRWDEGEFDVITITRADGTQIATGRPLQGPPPWAGGRDRPSSTRGQHQDPFQNDMRPQGNRLQPGQTLTGTVVGYGEDDENEWFVQTATGVILADAGSRENQVIDIPQGEVITLIGRWDEGEFDVIAITRADGTQIFIDPDF
jgi:hypothetical protein